MLILIGLGNPGEEYEQTRHNIGFMVIERLAERFSIDLAARGRKTVWGTGEVAGHQIVLAKPLTYVNLSGQAASELMTKFGVDPAELIVVHDDLDLPRGKIRVRRKSGSGGHNGIKSIISVLGTQDFARIRIGIGRPPGRQEPTRFVLSPFTKRQWPEIEVALEHAVEAAISIVTEGFEQAMNKFNSN